MALEGKSEVEKFDRYASDYQKAHAASLSLSGEAPEFFAKHKLDCLRKLGVKPQCVVLDYGCGTGSLTTLLNDEYREVHGFDPSAKSLEVAKHRCVKASFHSNSEHVPDSYFDCVILSGVLHHIEPKERDAVLKQAVSRLKPGGRLVVFEHNPYNPLTLKAVRACPFDDDAILLRPPELVKLFRSALLLPVYQQYVLFFPSFLRALRPVEPFLRWCPLGAQTLTVGTRSA